MMSNGTDPMQPGTQYVRVINVGRRFGRGFNRLEKANPFQRVMAWILAIKELHEHTHLANTAAAFQLPCCSRR